MNIPDNERIDDPFQEMDHLANTLLDLRRWEFNVHTRISSTSPKIIYASDYCKVQFYWEGWDHSVGYTMGILYGRLYAPDNEISMLWQGNECRCWHHVEPAPHFLGWNRSTQRSKNVF